jgi:hypothetical protein
MIEPLTGKTLDDLTSERHSLSRSHVECDGTFWPRNKQL